ncbi:RNA-binding protein 45 isoform X3 [Xenopus laevis]|uniref:RNA-binding protein 45 isoform X3 n=1 Tax=Xenopus laevis TaxID=8355 RepID=A0A8J1LR90_XENLA|nr:RNA-binding protein 45 isoform X3 [Xenopus laevis]
MEDSSGFRPSVGNLDDPPNSRVFLVVSKYATEDLIRERFSDFGEIQDIWVVKDKQTKESKGIAFVKYSKSSQACRAMEEMHGRCLSESTKPIKEYGHIEYCLIIKNKSTGESKGLAYVRFLKPSQAALAIENCDRSFKAILAEPKNKGGSGGGVTENDYHSSARQEALIQHDHTAAATVFSYEYDYSSYDKNADARTQETISKRLIVVSRLPMIQEQVHNLFDLIPGLEYCEVQRDPYNSFGHAIVQYQNISSAIYAKYKLHGFEYPPGNRLGVTYLNDGGDGSELLRKMASQMVAAQVSSMVWGSSQHYPTAPPFERAYGSPVTSQLQTDAALPSIKKKAPSDAQSKERLFIVFNPHPLPLDIMEDAFCRFGNLIEVYIVPGKNVGYARYADVSSANDAIAVLHGKMVNGVKLKVMQADSPRDESNKRQRTY